MRSKVDPTSQSATNPVPDFYGVYLTLFLHSFPHAHLSIFWRDRPHHHFFLISFTSANKPPCVLVCVFFTGEKIGSLHQYRQWLRDQSRYKKKSKWLAEWSLELRLRLSSPSSGPRYFCLATKTLTFLVIGLNVVSNYFWIQTTDFFSTYRLLIHWQYKCTLLSKRKGRPLFLIYSSSTQN